jgi:hypothetical protein
MATIQLNDSFRIKSDRYCWKLQKYCGIDKKTGKETWESEQYYNSLERACRGWLELGIRLSDAETMQGVLAHHERLLSELKSALGSELFK